LHPPAVDRTECNDAQHWHDSGPRGLVQRPQDELPQRLDEPYNHALRDAQRSLTSIAAKEPEPS
jgi:hypothetical protein